MSAKLGPSGCVISIGFWVVREDEHGRLVAAGLDQQRTYLPVEAAGWNAPSMKAWSRMVSARDRRPSRRACRGSMASRVQPFLVVGDQFQPQC